MRSLARSVDEYHERLEARALAFGIEEANEPAGESPTRKAQLLQRSHMDVSKPWVVPAESD